MPSPPEPPPFGRLGGLDYDETSDTLRCHVCGGWFRSLSQHARLAHGLSADEYRREFGLNRQTRLMSPGLRDRLREVTAPLIARLRAEGKLRNWAEDPAKWEREHAMAMEAIRREGLRPEGRRHARERWDEESRAERAEQIRRRNLSGEMRATPEAISEGLKRYYAEHPEAVERNRERLREQGRCFRVTERTARDAVCPRCRETFRAMSHREKYCPVCRPEALREYQREYARRRRGRG